jgi:haloalkane dehalogenase
MRDPERRSIVNPIAKHHVAIDGQDIAYVEAGAGRPIVLVHGNPTSSHLWRHTIPHLATLGRCLAPDLLGMGDSGTLDSSGDGDYRFEGHRRWFDSWMTAVGATVDVTFVLHDWGSALGFDWARRHPRAVRGIAYMEAIVGPLESRTLDPELAGLFRALRSPLGEAMVLEQNMFIENVLAGSLRDVDASVLDEYRRPFGTPGESRRPMLAWAREVPIDGHPADVHDLVAAYAAWLETSDVPKLFVNAEPGAALTGAARERCRRWPNQREVTVHAGHFVPEDLGPLLGPLLAGWIHGLDSTLPVVA